MKRYEGLFILDLAGREDGLNEAVEKVKTIIASTGAKVETVQKMEKRPFVRVTDKKVTGGHYVNVIFEALPAAIVALPNKFLHVAEVCRVLFSEASNPIPVPTPAAVPVA